MNPAERFLARERGEIVPSKYRIFWKVNDNYGSYYEIVEANSPREARLLVQEMPVPVDVYPTLYREVTDIEDVDEDWKRE